MTDHTTPDASSHKGKTGLKRVWNAFFYSMAGFSAAFKNEDAFRQEVLLALILIPLALFLPVTGVGKALMIGAVLLLLMVELLNSAIEKLADRVTPAPDPLIKRVKDMASAAVGVTIVVAGLVWLYAVGERLIQG